MQDGAQSPCSPALFAHPCSDWKLPAATTRSPWAVFWMFLVRWS